MFNQTEWSWIASLSPCTSEKSPETPMPSPERETTSTQDSPLTPEDVEFDDAYPMLSIPTIYMYQFSFSKQSPD